MSTTKAISDALPSSHLTRVVVFLWLAMAAELTSMLDGNFNLRTPFFIFFYFIFSTYCIISIKNGFVSGRNLFALVITPTLLHGIAQAGSVENLQWLAIALQLVAMYLLFFGKARTELKVDANIITAGPIQEDRKRDDKLVLGKGLLVIFLIFQAVLFLVVAKPVGYLATTAIITVFVLQVFLVQNMLNNVLWARSALVIYLAGYLGFAFFSMLANPNWGNSTLYFRLLTHALGLASCYLLATSAQPTTGPTAGLVVRNNTLKWLVIMLVIFVATLPIDARRISGPALQGVVGAFGADARTAIAGANSTAVKFVRDLFGDAPPTAAVPAAASNVGVNSSTPVTNFDVRAGTTDAIASVDAEASEVEHATALEDSAEMAADAATVAAASEARAAAGSAPDSVSVTDVVIGRPSGTASLGLVPSQTFGPYDNPTVQIHTSASGSGTVEGKLTALWTHVDSNQTVHEQSKMLEFDGGGTTIFSINKPDGFPVGDYAVTVLLNDRLVRSVTFFVQTAP